VSLKICRRNREGFRGEPSENSVGSQGKDQKLNGHRKGCITHWKVYEKKGLKTRAVGFLPSKVDPEKQKTFLVDVLFPAIQAAKSGIIELFFLDASHFVQGGVPSRVWSKVRMWVKTGSGRKRFNVLGSLNFVTKCVETIANETYITSTEVVEMLEKLAVKYSGKIIKIVLDNARYQRCELVITKARELGIELLFLPTYSPNLNLIERVWKFVKTRV